MRRTLCKVVLAGLQGAKPIQFNRLLTLVAHAGAQSRASPPFRRSTRGLDSITKLLSESSGVDAGNYATKQIFDGIIAGDVKLTDGAVVAALSRAVLLMSGAVKPAPILEALSKFVDIQSHVPDATSSGSLNDVWDAFAEAGLRHPDPTVALSVVSAVVTSRATLSPRVVCGYVDAHRSYLDGLKESTKRRELQASTVGSPRLALSSNSLCGRKSLMLSPPQWGALLDSVKRHCRPAVTSSDCFAIMHILAELGDIKSVFEEFDRFEELLRLEGGNTVPQPLSFDPLFRACRRAGHANRGTKLLQVMEARGLKPSLRALEDLVIAYSLKGDSSAALSTLLSLLAPECATKPDTDTVMQVLECLAKAKRSDDIVGLLASAKAIGLLQDVEFTPDTPWMNLTGLGPDALAVVFPAIFKKFLHSVRSKEIILPGIIRVFHSPGQVVVLREMLTEYRIPSKRLNGYVVLTKVDILKSFAREAPTVGSSKSAARRRAREPYRNPLLPPTRGTSVRDSSAGMEEVDVSSDVSQGRRSLEDMPLDLKPRGDPDAVSDASGEEMDEDVSEDDFPFGDEEVEPVGRRALRRQSRVRGAPQRGGTATRLSFDGVGDMGEAEEDLKVIRRPAPSRKQQQQQAAAAASSKQPIGRSLWSFYGDTPQAAFPKRPRKLAKDNVGMTMEDVGPAKDDIRKRVGRTGRRRGV